MTLTEPGSAKGRATRLRILLAAVDVVAEEGAVAATLDSVCERANVSRGQLYHYFDDRADLVYEAVGATADAVLGFQADHLENLDSLAGISIWFDALVARQEDCHAHGGCPIGSLIGQLAERDETARLLLAAAIDKWEQQVLQGLLRMRAHGELAPTADPARLATSTMASVQGGLILTQVRRDPRQLRVALDGAMTTLLAATAQHL
jgi:TetR/AcrR family transcriptional regulator, transcriptional repressor for nem operon